MDKLQKAIDLISNKKNHTISGPFSDNVVRKAEKLLNIKLSKQHKYFYSKIGYMSFDDNEIFGIYKDDFSGKSVICAVETTIRQRKEENLPKDWVLFTSDGNDLCYLDYSNLDKNNEPPVILVKYDGKQHKKIKTISNNIADYIYNLVKPSNKLSRMITEGYIRKLPG